MKTTMRSLSIQQTYRKVSKYRDDIMKLMNSSKNVYNSALYVQRKWYEFHRECLVFYMENLQKYLPFFTKSDVEYLFKYSLSLKDEEKAKILYATYGNKSLLEYVVDTNLKEVLQSIRFTGKSECGLKQTTDDMLRTMYKIENSDLFWHRMQNRTTEHVKQLIEFYQRFKNVLATMTLNKKETTKGKETKEMERKENEKLGIVVNKPLTTRVAQRQTEKRKTRTTNPDKKKPVKKGKQNIEASETVKNVNLIPPSCINMMYTDIYVKESVSAYQELNSQSSQQTLRKLDAAYSSFFELRKKGIYANSPKYIKTERYNVIFQKNSFSVENGRVRLSVGKSKKKELQKNYISVDGEKKGYMYFKLPKMIRKKAIEEIELVPSQYESSTSFKIIYKYDISVPDTQDTDNLNKASIDLGIPNIITLFSPSMSSPLIYKGGPVLHINNKYNYLIDKLKSDIKTKYSQHTCTKLQDLLTRRANSINNYFHKVSNSVISICKEHNITELIIGYNVNWKSGVNMGKKNNRTFYSIPYSKLIHMLFYKGEQHGIRIVENEEAYTSKCDALANEHIGRHDNYMGKRVKRGLFKSSRQMLVNADVNGAINIMRKYVHKVSSDLSQQLNNFISNLPPARVCNPKVITKSLLMSVRLGPGSYQGVNLSGLI